MKMDAKTKAGVERQLDAIKQMREKKGPVYERWKRGVAAARARSAKPKK